MKRIFLLFLFFVSLNFFAKEPINIFPLNEIKEGIIAKGYTVLKGEEITEFEAEIIGVQKMAINNTDMIICKLKGKPFDQSGVIAAMSGSPLFVEDKFLGAIAVTWMFSKEPLCAATPAENMIQLFTKQVTISSSPSSIQTISFENFLENISKIDYSFHNFFKPFEEKNFSFTQSEQIPFSEETEIKEGGIIGVQLISGDLNLTAYGTVSLVKDNRFLAFGHQFLGLGQVDFPVVSAKVSTVMPSSALSFKISSPKEEIGRMVLDTPYGILCEKGVRADTIPLEISFTNSNGITEKRMVRLVRHPDLAKTLFFLSIFQICEQLENNKSNYHLKLETSEFLFENDTTLDLKKQFFGGNEPSLAFSSFLTEIFSLLTSNPFKKPKIKGIKLKITSEKGKSEGNLIEIKSNRNEVKKGEKIDIDALFQTFEKGISQLRFSMPTNNLPNQKIKVVVGDSLSLYKRVLKSLNFIPDSFESLIEVLKNFLEGGYVYSAVFADEEPILLGNKRLYSLPLTIKNSIPPSLQNTNLKSSEKIYLKPLPVFESGYFNSELELTIEIKEREEK